MAVPGWVVVGSRDLPRVDDADLAYALEPIDPAENLATHLDRIASGLTWLEGRDDELVALRRAERFDRRRATALLPRRAVFERLDRALQLPRFQIPVDEVEAAAVRLRGWQRIGRVLALRARLHAEAGARDDAFRDVQTLLRLGKRIEAAEGADLLHAMVGTSIRVDGLQAAESALRRARVDAATSFRLGNAIAAGRSDPKSWARAVAVEVPRARRAVESAVDEGALAWAARGEAPARWIPAAFRFHPHRTAERLARAYRRLADDPDGRCASLAPLRDWDSDDPWARWRVALSRNAGGELILARWTDPRAYAHRRCAADARVGAVQLLIALKAFESERRALPETLEPLRPFFLPALPRDPFTGEGLRYSRAHRRLHSPGSDGIDREGEREPEDPEYVEPSWAIPPLPAR